MSKGASAFVRCHLPGFLAELGEAASSSSGIALRVRVVFSFVCSERPPSVKEHQNKQSVEKE